VLPDLNR